MRLLLYNIRYAMGPGTSGRWNLPGMGYVLGNRANLKRITDFIKGQDPDIVGLVEVDTATCTVPGYRFNTSGVTEDFDAGVLPDGWTVEDNIGNGQVWRFDNPDGRDNLTGGSGGFAIMDSDFYGSGGSQDTSLVTPSIDMSSLTAPVVGFRQDYNNLGDFADVAHEVGDSARAGIHPPWLRLDHQSGEAGAVFFQP